MLTANRYDDAMVRSLTLLLLVLAGCQSGVYVRDGVTDGDTFYVAPLAYASNDPVVASWVRYSLIRSTCQLDVGGENPARVSTYDCELRARHHLVDAWIEELNADDSHSNSYLNALLEVRDAGFLDEYVAHYLGEAGWEYPSGLERDAFRRWRRDHLRRHRVKTRLIGYWAYRDSVSTPP